MATITLTTTDGASRVIPVVEGLSVVEAAKQAGTIIPSVCGKGACGACVGHVTGEYETRPHEAEALGACAGDNAVLLCCCIPHSDLEVNLPYDENRLLDSAPQQRQGTIQAIEALTETIIKLTLSLIPDSLGSAAEFEPGQYLQLEVPGTGELRAYSMSNIANWDGTFEFLIHLREGGRMSTYLRDKAAVGDTLRMVGPQGSFALVENGMKPRWFVGGGCGFAPLLSMLRRMAEWGEPQPSHLFLGVNTAADVFADHEIADLQAGLPNLEVTTAVWQCDGTLPDSDVGCVVAGSAVDALATALQHVGETPDIYVCGPPGMVTALESQLVELGIAAQNVHTERITEN